MTSHSKKLLSLTRPHEMPGRSLLFCISLSWRRSNEPVAEVALMARESEVCRFNKIGFQNGMTGKVRSSFPVPSPVQNQELHGRTYFFRSTLWWGCGWNFTIWGAPRSGAAGHHSAFDAIRLVAWGSEPSKHAAEALGYQPTHESCVCSTS